MYDAEPVASSVAIAEEVRSTTCGSAASSTPGSPTYSSTIEPSRSVGVGGEQPDPGPETGQGHRDVGRAAAGQLGPGAVGGRQDVDEGLAGDQDDRGAHRGSTTACTEW